MAVELSAKITQVAIQDVVQNAAPENSWLKYIDPFEISHALNAVRVSPAADHPIKMQLNQFCLYLIKEVSVRLESEAARKCIEEKLIKLSEKEAPEQRVSHEIEQILSAMVSEVQCENLGKDNSEKLCVVLERLIDFLYAHLKTNNSEIISYPLSKSQLDSAHIFFSEQLAEIGERELIASGYYKMKLMEFLLQNLGENDGTAREILQSGWISRERPCKGNYGIVKYFERFEYLTFLESQIGHLDQSGDFCAQKALFLNNYLESRSSDDWGVHFYALYSGSDTPDALFSKLKEMPLPFKDLDYEQYVQNGKGLFHQVLLRGGLETMREVEGKEFEQLKTEWILSILQSLPIVNSKTRHELICLSKNAGVNSYDKIYSEIIRISSTCDFNLIGFICKEILHKFESEINNTESIDWLFDDIKYSLNEWNIMNREFLSNIPVGKIIDCALKMNESALKDKSILWIITHYYNELDQKHCDHLIQYFYDFPDEKMKYGAAQALFRAMGLQRVSELPEKRDLFGSRFFRHPFALEFSESAVMENAHPDDRAFCYFNLGRVKEDEGDTDGALPFYRRVSGVSSCSDFYHFLHDEALRGVQRIRGI